MRLSLAALGLTVCASCGELTNQDLFFAEIVPDSAELTASLPASDTQSTRSIGRESEAFLLSLQTSRDSSQLIEDTLGAVETLPRIVAPSIRETNARVWGPFFDEHSNGYFFLEVTQLSENSFDFCVRFSSDEIPAAALGCRTIPTQPELQLAVAGNVIYQPDGTREGTILLQLEDLLELQFNLSEDRRRVSGQLLNEAAIEYEYEESIQDGAVTFALDLEDDFDRSSAALEQLEIRTSWLPTGGTGTTTVSGGDLGQSTLSVTECWSPSGIVSYESIAITDMPPSIQGDITTCPTLSIASR